MKFRGFSGHCAGSKHQDSIQQCLQEAGLDFGLHTLSSRDSSRFLLHPTLMSRAERRPWKLPVRPLGQGMKLLVDVEQGAQGRFLLWVNVHSCLVTYLPHGYAVTVLSSGVFCTRRPNRARPWERSRQLALEGKDSSSFFSPSGCCKVHKAHRGILTQNSLASF